MSTTTSTIRILLDTDARDYAFNDHANTTPLRELYLEIRALLDDPTTLPGISHEGLGTCYDWDDITPQSEREKRGWPPLTNTTKLGEIRYRWIAVFPVTGSNEGHYIHVDLIWQGMSSEGRTPLFLLKTFGGSADAIAIAGWLCKVLGV